MPNLLTFRPATPTDLPAIRALLTAANLPLDGVTDHLANFTLAFSGDVLVGAAAIEPHGTTGLLRSVAVREDHRGHGLGKTLTTRMIERARRHEFASLVLLTTTAEHFFARFGFQRIDRARLPEPLFASEELQGACPASATVMRLDLPEANA